MAVAVAVVVVVVVVVVLVVLVVVTTTRWENQPLQRDSPGENWWKKAPARAYPLNYGDWCSGRNVNILPLSRETALWVVYQPPSTREVLVVFSGKRGAVWNVACQ